MWDLGFILPEESFQMIEKVEQKIRYFKKRFKFFNAEWFNCAATAVQNGTATLPIMNDLASMTTDMVDEKIDQLYERLKSTITTPYMETLTKDMWSEGLPWSKCIEKIVPDINNPADDQYTRKCYFTDMGWDSNTNTAYGKVDIGQFYTTDLTYLQLKDANEYLIDQCGGQPCPNSDPIMFTLSMFPLAWGEMVRNPLDALFTNNILAVSFDTNIMFFGDKVIFSVGQERLAEPQDIKFNVFDSFANNFFTRIPGEAGKSADQSRVMAKSAEVGKVAVGEEGWSTYVFNANDDRVMPFVFLKTKNLAGYINAGDVDVDYPRTFLTNMLNILEGKSVPTTLDNAVATTREAKPIETGASYLGKLFQMAYLSDDIESAKLSRADFVSAFSGNLVKEGVKVLFINDKVIVFSDGLTVGFVTSPEKVKNFILDADVTVKAEDLRIKSGYEIDAVSPFVYNPKVFVVNVEADKSFMVNAFTGVVEAVK
jgi:hypothetical protein